MLDFGPPADQTTTTFRYREALKGPQYQAGLLTLETASENACLEMQQTRPPHSGPYAWPDTPAGKLLDSLPLFQPPPTVSTSRNGRGSRCWIV